MRSILVQAGQDRQNSARIDTALAITRATGGHLTLLIDTPLDLYVTTNPYGGTYVATNELEKAIAADDALGRALEGKLANGDVPFDVCKMEGAPLDAMLAAAGLADLIVVSRSCGYAGELAIESSCPVLVLNAAALPMPLDVACVAWDGGVQGARALRGAMPLLKACNDVRVLTVGGENKGDFPQTDPLRYLACHGIKAELTELAKGRLVEDAIAGEVARLGAQLLVMGAYSHTRLREFVFGGVTRHFLELSAGPALLLAH